jgi:hypothetical protein
MQGASRRGSYRPGKAMSDFPADIAVTIVVNPVSPAKMPGIWVHKTVSGHA